jgi:hypothetical protein
MPAALLPRRRVPVRTKVCPSPNRAKTDMILYDPTNGDVVTTPTECRPRTCFFMSKVGEDAPPIVSEVRSRLSALLAETEYSLIDATQITTGKDYLRKIWDLIVSVPMGMAFIYRKMPSSTLANVFYEIGMMQALGKDTLVIRESRATIPSDLVRTEYVPYDGRFEDRIRAFLGTCLSSAEYLATVAEQMERNPLLAIDYYWRAFLLTGHEEYCLRTDELLKSGEIGRRAKNSVEYLAAGFSRFAQQAQRERHGQPTQQPQRGQKAQRAEKAQRDKAARQTAATKSPR